jgi:hypothetical protein
MAENKTKPSLVSPEDYIRSIEDPERRADGQRLLKIMSDATGEVAVMWGSSIVGFGSYHYKYESGREGDSLKVGFSARKAALVLYGLVLYDEHEENNRLLAKLGKHTRGKGCLYIKSLEEIDEKVLRTMIENGYRTEYKFGS